MTIRFFEIPSSILDLAVSLRFAFFLSVFAPLAGKLERSRQRQRHRRLQHTAKKRRLAEGKRARNVGSFSCKCQKAGEGLTAQIFGQARSVFDYEGVI